MDGKQREARFEYLFRTYYMELCRYITYRLHWDEETAKQLATDAFVLLNQKWDSVKVDDENTVLWWLRSTAKYLCNDHYKYICSRPRLVQAEDDFFNGIVDNDLAEELRREASYQAMLDYIQKNLNEKDWLFFKAAFVDDMSTNQLMEIFGIKESSVHSKRTRLREKAQKIIKNYKKF